MDARQQKPQTNGRVPTCPPWCGVADGSPRHDTADGSGEILHEKILRSLEVTRPDGSPEEVWFMLRQLDTAEGRQPPVFVIVRHLPGGIAEFTTGDAAAVRGVSAVIGEAADALAAVTVAASR
jgi:hypothetical protein